MEPEVLIFKTNVNTFEQMKKVDAVLSAQIGIMKWNIDLNDCDKVLRIETSEFQIENVIDILKPHAIYCEALE